MKEKKYLMINGWIQKTVRITSDYNKLCSLLEFFAKDNNMDVRKIYNEVVIFSLNKLYKEGFHYRLIPYDGRREPKGFLLEVDTTKQLKDSFEVYKNLYYLKEHKKLLYAEFIELLMFIYCNNHLEADQFKYTKINWGIVDIKDISK